MRGEDWDGGQGEKGGGRREDLVRKEEEAKSLLNVSTSPCVTCSL